MVIPDSITGTESLKAWGGMEHRLKIKVSMDVEEVWERRRECHWRQISALEHWNRKRKWILGKSTPRFFQVILEKNLQSFLSGKHTQVENWKLCAWCHWLWTPWLPETNAFFLPSTFQICLSLQIQSLGLPKSGFGKYSYLCWKEMEVVLS